eukprot:GHRR01007508.1.p1 GENE.GHRR01007508.1~~GHRR01007508.1.p1  ORF type:complete len:247 (+),score=72.82 GHRR01007508.1:209-949(+)
MLPKCLQAGRVAVRPQRLQQCPSSVLATTTTTAHVFAAACSVRSGTGTTCHAHNHSSEGRTQYSRRQLLQISSVLGACLCSTSGLAQPAAAAASATATSRSSAAACQLQTSLTGLKWCDLVAGDGALPIQGAFTKAHYTAKLASNDFVFDSSYQRKQPLIFKVGEREVIEAFDVAMLGAEDIPPMHEGGKRLIVAPPGPMQKQGTKSLVWMVGMLDALEDAGELSAEGTPASDLVFEVELLPKRKK